MNSQKSCVVMLNFLNFQESPLSSSSSGIVQIEAFLHQTADLEKVKNKLKEFVSRLFDGCQIEDKSVDGQITRQVYFPPEETL